MGISTKVQFWLNDLGHHATNLSDEGLHQLADIAIIEKSSLEKRIILTADMDFGNLLATNPALSVPIIQFRVTDFRSPNVIAKLQLVFDVYADQLHEHFIITVEDKRIRYRKLPI